MLSLFVNAFNSGATFAEAVQQSGFPDEAHDLLANYWNLMLMDEAVKQAATYFDRLQELAA